MGDDDPTPISGRRIYGAVARDGAKAARSMSTKVRPRPGPVPKEDEPRGATTPKEKSQPKKKQKVKGKPTAAVARLTKADQQVLHAWGDYERSLHKLLRVTDTSSLNSAATKARGALQRKDAIEREMRRGKGAGKVPKPGPSRSIRTVSGGSPGLGKRR